MNITIIYSEIADFCEKEFRLRPQFTRIDNSRLCISYKPSLFMPTISVELQLDALNDDCICMTYYCNAAASLIISGIVAYIEQNIPKGIVVDTSDKRIDIYPQRVEQLEQVLKYTTLSDISFTDMAVSVALSLKN